MLGLLVLGLPVGLEVLLGPCDEPALGALVVVVGAEVLVVVVARASRVRAQVALEQRVLALGRAWQCSGGLAGARAGRKAAGGVVMARVHGEKRRWSWFNDVAGRIRGISGNTICKSMFL